MKKRPNRKIFFNLAGVLFALLFIFQLNTVIFLVPITIGYFVIPLWWSYIAMFIFFAFSYVSFMHAREENKA